MATKATRTPADRRENRSARSDENGLTDAAHARVRHLAPTRASDLLKRGNALNRQGKRHQALEAYQEALCRDGGMCEAHINTAATLQALGRTQAAEQSIRRALAMQPDHPDALFIRADILFADGRSAEAIRYYAKVLEIDPEHAPAWLHQGHAWKRKGLLKKAAASYRRASELEPDNPNPSYYLGATLHALKDYAGARQALHRTVVLNPENLPARHLLDALTGAPVSQSPRTYIEALFDRYAASFDSHMEGLLNYRIPRILRKHLKAIARRRGRFRRMLDIGCGTGLAAAALRDLTRFRVGVDLSRKILEMAEAKSIYDRLIQDDFVNYLATTDQCFDLVIAADVFIYTGDLSHVFGLIRQRLAPDGWLAFSTEKDPDGDFRLQRSCRFAHSRAYITRLAGTHEFQVATARPVTVRMDNRRWIDGEFFILRPQPTQAGI